MRHAEDGIELMEVLVAIAMLNDDKGDERHASIEDNDITVGTFRNDVHCEDDVSIYRTIATTADDQASQNMDDIFLVANATGAKAIADKETNVCKHITRSTNTS